VIRADAHDLGAGGFELRQGRLEAVQFLGSGGRERRDERVEDHGAFGRQVGELDRFALGPNQREIGRLLSNLERSGRAPNDQSEQHTGKNAYDQ
jgi:hypothetical protein